MLPVPGHPSPTDPLSWMSPSPGCPPAYPLPCSIFTLSTYHHSIKIHRMYLMGGRSVFRSRAWTPHGQGFVSTSVAGGAGKSAQSTAGAGVCVRRKPRGSQMSSHRRAPWCCFNRTCCQEPPLSTVLCFPGSLLCHRTLGGQKRDGGRRQQPVMVLTLQRLWESSQGLRSP